jgi:hypothetical protein
MIVASGIYALAYMTCAAQLNDAGYFSAGLTPAIAIR